MMAERINHTDLEILSAYLDGQISPTERQRLESRLAQEPALRSALADLRRTRQLLRVAPQAQRRRSFALTPEMVRPPRRMQRAFSTMRLVSVVASLLFAVVFIGNAFTAGFRSGSIALAPASADMAEEQAFDLGATEIESLAAADEADDANGLDAPAGEEPPAEDEAGTDQRDAAAPEGAQPSQVAELSEGVLYSTATPQGAGTPAPYDAAAPSPTTGMSPTGPPLTTSKTDGSGETDLPEAQEAGADGQGGVGTGERDRNLVPIITPAPLQFIKGGLALVAVVSGALALVLRKRVR